MAAAYKNPPKFEEDCYDRWKSRTILIEEILSSNKTLQSNQGVESAIQTKIVMIKFKLRCLAVQEKHLVAKRNWYNIKISKPSQLEGGELSIDLSQFSDLEIAEPEDVNSDESVLLTNEVDFNEAKSVELDTWKKNKVYTEVEDVGQKCISTRWVCSLKSNPDGIISADVNNVILIKYFTVIRFQG